MSSEKPEKRKHTDKPKASPKERSDEGEDGKLLEGDDDYDRSLEYRQLARWIILTLIILVVVGVFIYIIFFVD